MWNAKSAHAEVASGVETAVEIAVVQIGIVRGPNFCEYRNL
jgi:hypothetical protein